MFLITRSGTIVHNDGSGPGAWTIMDSGTTNALYSIWGPADDSVYAGGSEGTMLHYNGSAWSSVDIDSTYNINDIYGFSASDIFALTSSEWWGGEGSLLLHYDGASWSEFDIGEGEGYYFDRIWGTSDTNLYFTGTSLLPTPWGTTGYLGYYGDSPPTVIIAGDEIRSSPELSATDLNGDGRTDLLYVDLKGYVFYTTDLRTWNVIGTNRFSGIVPGDFSDNGTEKDVAGINLNNYILYSTDTANWTKIGENRFTSLVSADFSSSGTRENVAGINMNRYVLYTDDLTAWTKIGANKFTSLASIDFDGNGVKDDIAGINLHGYILYTTDLTNWNKVGSNKFTSLVAGDFDGDGAADDIAAVNLNHHVLYTTDLSSWTKITRP